MKAIAVILLLLLSGGMAQAHKPSDSYLTATMTAAGLSLRWDIALRDLDFALGLDTDGDRNITWGEVRSRERLLYAYASQHLQLSIAGRTCPLAFDDLLIDAHTDGQYAVLLSHAPCQPAGGNIVLSYQLFFDLDPQHRGLLQWRDATGVRSTLFTPAERTFVATPGSATHGDLVRFIVEGVWHIWLGYDHVLFLLSLLLPAVLVYGASGWQRLGSLRQSARNTLVVVSAFTAAHSLTLSLAALGFVQLPARWVESAIAASVVIAALNNIWPLLHGRQTQLALLFGLVHGLGFAGVLADLGLPRSTRLWSLLGFNLGVELGQLALVSVFLPINYILSRWCGYPTAVLKGGSAVVSLIGAIWFFERALARPFSWFAG